MVHLEDSSWSRDFKNSLRNTEFKVLVHRFPVADYRPLEDLEFESRQRLGIFLFTTASRTALGPTQPPIQWVPGVLSVGVKRPGREADHISI
jgi:hypothetical protein